MAMKTIGAVVIRVLERLDTSSGRSVYRVGWNCTGDPEAIVDFEEFTFTNVHQARRAHEKLHAIFAEGLVDDPTDAESVKVALRSALGLLSR